MPDTLSPQVLRLLERDNTWTGVQNFVGGGAGTGDVSAATVLAANALLLGDTGAKTIKALVALGSVGQILRSAGPGLPPAFVNHAGELLAVTSYNPSSLTDVSITSTSGADVDATNLTITFTVPTSGNVLVCLTATAFSSTSAVGMLWLLRTTGGANVAGTKFRVTPASATTGLQFPVAYRVRVTGLTPGASQTYRWGAMMAASGTGHIRYGDDTNATGDEYGPAVMEVWSAP